LRYFIILYISFLIYNEVLELFFINSAVLGLALDMK
jgi:hypothetical protein